MEKELVKSLSPTLLEVTPQSVIKQLSKQFDLRTQSIRKILEGEWSRPDVVAKAVEMLREKQAALNAVLKQVNQAAAAT
jgi:hypothetical protein